MKDPSRHKSERVASLPLPVRALARFDRVQWSQAAALRALGALARSDRTYRSSEEFVLRIDPEDHFQGKMALGWFDPVLIELLQRYATPGSVAIDIGGYVGYVALHLARAVGTEGEVHTFECDPRLTSRIEEHADLNEAKNIRVNAMAAFDRSGEQLELRLTDQLGWATLQEGVWESSGTAQVKTVALDDYIRQREIDPARISVIKLDIEGAELTALEGMRKTLAATSAAVFVEYQPWRVELAGRDPADLRALLAACGYSPWAPHASSERGLTLTPGTSPGVGEDLVFLKNRSGDSN